VNAIRRAIAEQHGLRAQTVRLLSAGALPRTSSGKIMRGEARARFLHDRFRYLDAEMSAEPLLPGRP